MLAWNVLKRALSDTIALLGLSPRRWTRIIVAFFLILVPIIGKWSMDGFPEAKKAILEFKYFWPCLIGLGAVLLWNLWLAPYKLIWEKLDKQDKLMRVYQVPKYKKSLIKDLERFMHYLSGLIAIEKTTPEILSSGYIVEPARDADILRSRYASLLPKNINFEAEKEWVGKALSVIQDTQDPKVAERIIREKVKKGSWDG